MGGSGLYLFDFSVSLNQKIWFGVLVEEFGIVFDNMNFSSHNVIE